MQLLHISHIKDVLIPHFKNVISYKTLHSPHYQNWQPPHRRKRCMYMCYRTCNTLIIIIIIGNYFLPVSKKLQMSWNCWEAISSADSSTLHVTFPQTVKVFSEKQRQAAVRTQLVADKLSPKWPPHLHNTSWHGETETNNTSFVKCCNKLDKKALKQALPV